MKIDIIQPCYETRSRSIEYQLCRNFYCETVAPGSKNVKALIGTPGLKMFFNDENNKFPCRGLYTTSTGRCFKIIRNKVTEIKTDKTEISIGELTTNAGHVDMSDNGSQLIIVDGKYGYIVELETNDFTKIEHFGAYDTSIPPVWVDDVSTIWPGSTCVVFIGGYFICPWGDNGEKMPFPGSFMWSQSYDGKKWYALDWANAEGSPDKLMAIKRVGLDLWLIGEQTIEVWYLSGNADAPFVRMPNAIQDNGTIAPQSVATLGNNIFWLGNNAAGFGSVWAGAGYQAQRISTHAIEYIISKLNRLNDAYAYCYQQEGHSFYVLNFERGDRTFVYDITTGLWHERGYYDENTGLNGRHLGNVFTFFNHKNIIGNFKNANIYEYDLNTFTDNGVIIKREKTSGHVCVENKRIFFKAIEFEFEKGVGLNDAPYVENYPHYGSDPQAMLQWSDNGGYVWSSEHWKPFGKIGSYKQRCGFNRLGYSRDRIFKLTITSPVKCVVIDCYADMVTENG